MKGKIFNEQEVQAIIAGKKTMFREVIMPQPILSPDKSYWEFKNVRWAGENSSYAKKFGDIAKPEMPEFAKFQVGEEIFVKEVFSYSNRRYCDYTMFYKATHGDRIQHTFYLSQREDNWRSPMVMQEYNSRITLRIKSVKVEKLAGISEEDCWKEGCEEFADYQDKIKVCEMAKQIGDCIEDPKPYFAVYWDSTNKKQEHKWETNPWVFVYEFEVINN